VKRAVFDAGALIALYENEPGALQVATLIQLARDRRYSLSISVVNWGEVYYVVWNGRGPGVARHTIEEIAQLPISIVPADLEQARLAAELKAQHKLPYADCFAASLALLQRATLVTADSDFALLRKKLPLLLLS
jgi:predicted nucleic acid-binding protein